MKEKIYDPTGLLDVLKKKDEVMRKKEGYNDKLDESLGSRNKGKKKQSMKDRRDESKGMEKAKKKRAYSAVKTMDKSSKKKVKNPRAKISKVMDEYKEGKLHSGSKKGPKVKSKKQALAIALSEAGISKKRK